MLFDGVKTLRNVESTVPDNNFVFPCSFEVLHTRVRFSFRYCLLLESTAGTDYTTLENFKIFLFDFVHMYSIIHYHLFTIFRQKKYCRFI